MNFSPRLNQILFLLLNAEKAIPAKKLADNLNISKRTIFRELENINVLLSGYGLSVETKSKKGILIIGDQDSRERLLKQISNLDDLDPKNILERQNRLILEILKQDEPQKIFYYSSILQVSEATINRDLDYVQDWFQTNNIQLMKKPGLGIYILCQEENYRKACMRYIYQTMALTLSDSPLCSLIDPAIVEDIAEFVQSFRHPKIKTMAVVSYNGLILYLSILVMRLKKGKAIDTIKVISQNELRSSGYELALSLLGHIGNRFNIEVPKAETSHLYIFIQGAKIQHINNETLPDQYFEDYFDLYQLIYEMIHRFDKTAAYNLKQDEEFINGLLAHLKPLIIRLQNKIETHNPLQAEIEKNYPDIYEKTQKAVKVMEDILGCQMPENEIGLIALHFGGATVRLKNRENILFKITVGIVCASGIGISAMLSSRIEHIFHNKVNVKCLSFSDVSEKNTDGIDLLLSTFPLDEYGVEECQEYTLIHPLLSDEDIDIISAQIKQVAKRKAEGGSPGESVQSNVMQQIEELNLITAEISSILESFCVLFVDSRISFNELMHFASRQLGEEPALAEIIFHDLSKREALSTQVIPEYQFVLLHSQTAGVKNTKFILLLPQSQEFADVYFQQTKVAVVILIPRNDPRQMLAISAISKALFEDDLFLQMVLKGAEDEIKKYIEKILKKYLADFLKNFL